MLDELFLRQHMQWALPDAKQVRHGIHPAEWDGSPVFTKLDEITIERVDALLRRMSVLRFGRHTSWGPARLVSLFAQLVEVVVPHLLLDDHWDPDVVTARDADSPVHVLAPVARPIRPEIREVVELLRGAPERAWSVDEMARIVALSSVHFARLFRLHAGTSPMRFLNELRVSEFARLVSETTMPVEAAARSVGWQDSRVAAAWFRRRYGVTPSEHRRRLSEQRSRAQDA